MRFLKLWYIVSILLLPCLSAHAAFIWSQKLVDLRDWAKGYRVGTDQVYNEAAHRGFGAWQIDRWGRDYFAWAEPELLPILDY
jgi:hypothetical protein